MQDTKLACILNLDYSRENLCNLVVNNVAFVAFALFVTFQPLSALIHRALFAVLPCLLALGDIFILHMPYFREITLLIILINLKSE